MIDLPIFSIRARLTLTYAIFVGLLLVVCGGVLFGVVRYQLLRHHDPSLKDTAAKVEAILSRREDCIRLDPVQIQDLNRLDHLILFHETGGERQIFYRSPDSDGIPTPSSLEAMTTTVPFETLMAGGESLRVHSLPYRSQAGRQGLIRVMDRLGDVEEPLHALALSLLFMVPVAILFAALGGYWMASRALSPVDRITQQARAIGAQNLASRIPHPGNSDELGRLVDTLNRMFERLERTFEGMKRFTSDASHELRSPLAIMRSTIDVALNRPRTPEEYRCSLESLGEEVDRIRKISADLLLLARADSGRLELELTPLNLGLLATEVVDAFQILANAKEVQLESSTSGHMAVLGDERWLRQALANLVDNAIKFTPTAGQVWVDLAQEASWVRITVKDSGPGIPKEHLSRIFERFYQADSARTRDAGQGAGLGLSITAWIVEAHGGSLSVENRIDGHGCSFSLRLPHQPRNSRG
ncbi:MAG: heavy metal sensor histidine kinase [Acidobacteria bacterium]|nr:heavy metal sensor histidine kinase [Acidobacteriota bacterium]